MMPYSIALYIYNTRKMYTPRVRINKKIYRSIPRSNEVKAKFYLSSSLLTLYHHHIINTHKNSYRYTTHHQPKMILCVCRTIKVHFHICRKKNGIHMTHYHKTFIFACGQKEKISYTLDVTFTSLKVNMSTINI